MASVAEKEARRRNHCLHAEQQRKVMKQTNFHFTATRRFLKVIWTEHMDEKLGKSINLCSQTNCNNFALVGTT